MLLWLIGVAVFVVLWGALWKASPKGGFGVLHRPADRMDPLSINDSLRDRHE